jgi:CRISPR-associated protein Cas1
MIKRTLCFSTPGKLRLHLRQLLWRGEDGKEASAPIEDLGLIILESPLISVSTALLQALTEACVAVVLCDASHLPSGYLLPQASHTLASRFLRNQIELTDAQAGRLWQQIITRKIQNQASVIQVLNSQKANELYEMAEFVKRGDVTNIEAQAAKLYFTAFPIAEDVFHRSRYGTMPNAALNYGYAILRASVARSLVASGLNTTLGIHHRNQYNHFCLADDVMEPYRPFVDPLVLEHLEDFEKTEEPTQLSPKGKRLLLPFLTMDVRIGESTRPLFNALQLTTASLARCIGNEQKTLELPAFP